MAYADFVIVTKDNPGLLGNLLNSINMGGLLFTDLVKVIVVNNGSPASLAKLKEQDLPQIQIVQMEENVGWERGLAEGVKYATAPILGILNDDIQFTPEIGRHLREMMALFRDPAVGAVGTTSNYVMGKQSLFWFPPENAGRMLWEVPYLINFFCLVRREAFLDVGGVDTSFHNGGDDLDQSIRLRKAGYKLLLDRTTFVYHHGSQTGTALHGTYWNSEAHLEPIQHQLIRKHGFLGWWNCVYGPAMPYRAPGQDGSDPRWKEEALMIPWIPKDGTVLEVGCGDLKLVPWSVGVDIVPLGDGVAQIGGKSSLAQVTSNLNDPLPYADGTVNGIVAKHVIEHLVDTLGVLRDWHRAMKPGGRLIVTTPDEHKVSGISLNPEHVHVFTPESLTRVAEAAGFKTIIAEDTNNGVSFLYVGERNGGPHV